MQQYRPPQLAAYLQDHHPLLLDVREPWEFALCSLQNSRLIPMGKIPSQLDKLDSEQEIVLICHHGIRSRQVGLFLQAQGFAKLINLSGGLDAWAKEIDNQMATY